jgi:hypothetical protein
VRMVSGEPMDSAGRQCSDIDCPIRLPHASRPIIPLATHSLVMYPTTSFSPLHSTSFHSTHTIYSSSPPHPIPSLSPLHHITGSPISMADAEHALSEPSWVRPHFPLNYFLPLLLPPSLHSCLSPLLSLLLPPSTSARSISSRLLSHLPHLL